MRRLSVLFAVLALAAAGASLPTSSASATNSPFGQEAGRFSRAGSVVQLAQCIRYCVRKQRCRFQYGNRRCYDVPVRQGGVCVQWATACKGGHY